MSQSLLKLLKADNAEPAHPASLVPSSGKHTKGGYPQFPSLPLPPDWPLGGVLCSPQGAVSITLL